MSFVGLGACYTRLNEMYSQIWSFRYNLDYTISLSNYIPVEIRTNFYLISANDCIAMKYSDSVKIICNENKLLNTKNVLHKCKSIKRSKREWVLVICPSGNRMLKRMLTKVQNE